MSQIIKQHKSYANNFDFIPIDRQQIFVQIDMQKQQLWPFGSTKDYPFAFTYLPQLIPAQQDFLNPFLGYPNCPLIGRYNQGEYRIAQTKCHFWFHCLYDQKQETYKCGANTISLPIKMVYNLRNIPQIIKHNKPQNQGKNSKIQDVHPIKFPVRNDVKFIFMITFGQLGKDFLNYLNHMYTLAQDLFVDQKLRKSAFMLPIYAHLPYKSGIVEEQVDKGLCLQDYRSEFLSLHLKWGSPAFSPNNMRLGIEGMKKVVSNPPGNRKKKQLQKQKNQQSLDNFLQKGKHQQNKQNSDGQIAKIEQDLWSQVDLFDDVEIKKKQPEPANKQQYSKQQQEKKAQIKKGTQSNQPNQHKGFIHFYTSVLLQNDYRVYYHWHIDKWQRRELIQAALNKSNSIVQFLHKCKDLLGAEDECVMQAFKIFNLKE